MARPPPTSARGRPRPAAMPAASPSRRGQLAFDGATGVTLAQNMRVSINTQAGDVLLKIPPNIPAQITYNSPSGAVLEADPQYAKTNNITYTIGNYAASDGKRLTIEIRSV